MSKANRLFEKAELEYLTPFLKLWLSFNCWYKKDSEADSSPITTDSDAIKKYQKRGKIKHHFLRIFEEDSNINKKFSEALHMLIINTEENYELKDNNQKRVKYTCIYSNPNATIIKDNDLIKICSLKDKYYIRNDERDSFFADTLKIIYQIRCTLVHGDFDIDDSFFLELVESSYNILYPIMERVLE